MYDIIGDIHGHADALRRLLGVLGYEYRNGLWRHASRRVIFCGDFIDRGPEIRETLAIVRRMCDAGSALAVMGNHEFNALAFHTPHPEQSGQFLRRHTDKNVHQHTATLQQLTSQELHESLEWFRTLPVSIETSGIRVVHACWDPQNLQTLASSAAALGSMSTEFLIRATQPHDALFMAVERVLKGPEMRLPDGCFLSDKEGVRRPVARIRWFENPEGHSLASYALPATDDPHLHQIAVPSGVQPAVYAPDAPPVFFGHYWLNDPTPQPLAANVACLDYSVAKHGQLVACRYSGQSVLSFDNFVAVPADGSGHLTDTRK